MKFVPVSHLRKEFDGIVVWSGALRQLCLVAERMGVWKVFQHHVIGCMGALMPVFSVPSSRLYIKIVK